MMFRRLVLVAPLTAVLTAGCFATRNDVRLLQADVQRMEAALAEQNEQARHEAARRDSLRAAEIREIAQQLSVTDDSVRSLMQQFGAFRVRNGEETELVLQQLMQVAAAQGASRQQLAEMQARFEEMQARGRMTGADTGAVGDSAAAMAAPTEGPAMLYRAGFSMLQRNSPVTARATFEQLIAEYPQSEFAPRALLRIAETFTADSDLGAADSVLALVVEKYPKSPEAPTALYKRAYALERAGQTQRALQLYNRVISDYATSEEVLLARAAADRIRGR